MDSIKIDWSKPLEAVHTDGRVVLVSLDPEYPAPDNSGNYTLTDEPAGDSWYVWTSEGKSWIQEDHEWTIRNVAPKEVEWGPEIKVEGKRPEWLREDAVWQWRIKNDPQFENGIEPSKYVDARTFGLIDAIRLPANHLHYATPTRTALEQRMAAIMRALIEASDGDEDAPSCFIQDYESEARAILAELKPVDGDLLIAREIAADHCAKIDHVWEPLIRAGQKDDDEQAGVGLALTAIKRGRTLERGK